MLHTRFFQHETVGPVAAENRAWIPELTGLIHRARAEFTEMPGLRLTVAQAARLLALDRATSQTMLPELERMGFLMKRGDRYSRADDA